MTKGGLTTDQKMVDQFVESAIKGPEDFGKPLKLDSLGFDLTLTFGQMRELFARGLCLDLQRRERGPAERIKDSDIAGAIKADDPVGYLKSKGYSDRIITRIFKS